MLPRPAELPAREHRRLRGRSPRLARWSSGPRRLSPAAGESRWTDPARHARLRCALGRARGADVRGRPLWIVLLCVANGPARWPVGSKGPALTALETAAPL